MADQAPRRLFRSGQNRMIGGVLGGIGEYLDVDPAAVRAAYVIVAVLTGIMPMILAYILLLFIIPKKP
ncbi:MAG: PspC domain-containing protein [Candidatus Altiarchaeota archaeon]